MKSDVYTYEEVFEDDPENPENTLVTLPPEVMKKAGINIGDTVVISIENGSLLIKKKQPNSEWGGTTVDME